jgi:hypothetical protein
MVDDAIIVIIPNVLTLFKKLFYCNLLLGNAGAHFTLRDFPEYAP